MNVMPWYSYSLINVFPLTSVDFAITALQAAFGLNLFCVVCARWFKAVLCKGFFDYLSGFRWCPLMSALTSLDFPVLCI